MEMNDRRCRFKRSGHSCWPFRTHTSETSTENLHPVAGSSGRHRIEHHTAFSIKEHGGSVAVYKNCRRNRIKCEAKLHPSRCGIDGERQSGAAHIERDLDLAPFGGRGQDRNLNVPGSYFEQLAFEKPADSLNRDDAGRPPNRFYAYGVIARLALVAAAIELEKMEQALKKNSAAPPGVAPH